MASDGGYVLQFSVGETWQEDDWEPGARGDRQETLDFIAVVFLSVHPNEDICSWIDGRPFAIKNISGYSHGGRSHDPIRPYLVSLAAPPRIRTRREREGEDGHIISSFRSR